MRFRRPLVFPILSSLVAGLLLVAMAACGDADEYRPGQVVVPESVSDLRPTPVPERVRAATEEFVQEKDALEEEWNSLQQRFDEWRTGLTDCSSSMVDEALRGFAADFTRVTSRARQLPRSPVAGELADVLVEAAEGEEQAYRMLRDRWQPENVSFYEAVEQRRLQSASAQQQVADRIAELEQQLEDAPLPEEVEELTEDFNALRDRWKDFHDDFLAGQRAIAGLQEDISELRLEVAAMRQAVAAERAAAAAEALAGMETAPQVNRDSAGPLLEKAEAELEAGEAELRQMLRGIPSLEREFGDIVDRVDSLPNFEVIETVLESLLEAAVAELEALQALEESSEMTALAVASVEVGIERSEAVLAETSVAIRGIENIDPEKTLEDLTSFEAAYDRLVGEWGDFQTGFNEWRRAEGGCDRAKALQDLDRFAVDFAQLGRKARDLPQASHLLPMYNLLTDAVAREEGAMRALRNSWRPFTVDVFSALDAERTNSDRLRRDANIALQQLSERTPQT